MAERAGPAEGGDGLAGGGDGHAEHGDRLAEGGDHPDLDPTGGEGALTTDGTRTDPAYWWGLHLGAEVDPGPTRDALSEGTLVAAAEATAARWPDREALRVDDAAITHAELRDASHRLARWLGKNGAGLRSRVLVAAPNSIGLVVAYLAALRVGAAVTLTNPTLTPRELGALVERVRPAAVVASPDLVLRLPDTGGRGVPARLTLDPVGGMTRVTLNRGVTSAWMPGEVMALAPAEDAAVNSGDIAHLAFTSGTTGAPKAAPLTHGNVLASVRGLIGAWRWNADDVLVHALPLQHPHGLLAVQMAILTGSRSVVLSKFDPAALCRAVAENRASVLFAVPAVYARLLDWPGFPNADLSSLRLAVSGSAPLPARHSDALTEVLGHRPLERYGLTETGFVLSNLHDGDRLGGAVGYPLPGAEVRIVDPAGAPAPDGTVGEIVVRGPQVFAGYSDAGRGTGGADHGREGAGRETGGAPEAAGREADCADDYEAGGADHGREGAGRETGGAPEAAGREADCADDYEAGGAGAPVADTAGDFLPGGWFRTGDLGQRDPGTGAFSVTGRLKEMIITGGLNVYPVEVEQVLEAQPGVRAAAVAGLPSERWGEEVTAFVVADGPLDTAELAVAAAAELAPYKRPKRYVLVDDLPRNHMGKILRSRLVAPDRPEPGSAA